MTDSQDAAVDTLVDTLRETSDLVARYRDVKDIEAKLDIALKQVKAEIAQLLYDGRSWNKVGKLLGVTGSRAEQISRAAR